MKRLETEKLTPPGTQLALALPLPHLPQRTRRPARPCTRARASWWFDEMRRVVDAGLDYRAPGVR